MLTKRELSVAKTAMRKLADLDLLDRRDGHLAICEELLEAQPQLDTLTEIESEDVDRLCDMLAGSCQRNGVHVSRQRWSSWRVHAAALLLDDKRPLAEALRLAAWVGKDPFWRAHILSMRKLRQKYDTLRLQAIGTKNHRSPKADKDWTQLLEPADEQRQREAEKGWTRLLERDQQARMNGGDPYVHRTQET